MHSTKKILAVIPTVNHAERLKLEGILKYANEKRGSKWSIELRTDSWATGAVSDFDGQIIYVTSVADRERYAASDIPTVLIEDILQPGSVPRSSKCVSLVCDHESEGRAAAEYFLARHFTHFAFIGTGTVPIGTGTVPAENRRTVPDWCLARYRGFAGTVPEEMGTVPVCFDDNREKMKEFVQNLTFPCAVLCAHDIVARQVLATAEEAGITVPDDLAVLGVDDDEIICTTISPPISSIPTRDLLLGYNAGRILEELLTGRAKGARRISFSSSRVVSRRSTDSDALSDPFVARAITYARNHLSGKLDLVTLARHVGYSPRMLQLRAERALGHPLSEEIRRFRLSAALELLRNTDTPVDRIASDCGYTSTSHLSLRVKEATGLTPLRYRLEQI